MGSSCSCEAVVAAADVDNDGSTGSDKDDDGAGGMTITSDCTMCGALTACPCLCKIILTLAATS